MLAQTPSLTATWPIAGDAADLLAIVQDQAETITSQEALLHAYQLNLNAAQGGTGLATGTGTATGTSLVMTAVTGVITIGAVVTDGALVPSGTRIIAQAAGTTGGAGTYTTSQATTASATLLTFTAGASSNGAITTGATTSLVVTGTIGKIVSGATVNGTGNPTPPTVLGQISGATGGDGTYLLSSPVTLAVVSALSFVSPPPSEFSSWPAPQDAPTLDQIVQEQTAIIRTQTALIQHYQDLLNTSGVVAPPSGP